MSHNFWVEETVYRSQHPRLAELAFDSDRKLMSTMHKLDGVYTLCTKGAMDVLLARSVMVMTGDGPRPITEEDKQKIADTNLHLSENGLRVLAFAIKQYPDATLPIYRFFWLAVFGMIWMPIRLFCGSEVLECWS